MSETVPSPKNATPESRLIGPVRVVGAGLLGTSIGLGLRARGIDACQCFADLLVAAEAADRDPRTGGGECLRDGQADTGRGTGDQRRALGKEAVLHGSLAIG